MLTKNFEIWKKIFPLNNYKSSVVSCPEMTSIENVKINQVSATQSQNFQSCGLGVCENGSYGTNSSYYLTDLWIGKSTADESVNDYALDAFTASEVSGASTTVTRTINGDKISLSFTREFTNNSGATITVNEVGFVKTLFGNKSSDSSGYTKQYLFDRKKLIEPITIEPGAKHAFTYVIEM